MSDGYRKQRNIYGNYGGSLPVTALTGQTTLVSPRGADPYGGAYIIWVQRIHVHITGAGTGTWDVQDSNGTSLIGPISTVQKTTTVGDLQSVPTEDPIQAEFDFGPEGTPLVAGDSLVFVPSATGATGIITWDAYQRLPITSNPTFGS